MADLTKLEKWFSAYELRAYFGARTQPEIDYAVKLIRTMSAAHLAAFKETLSTANTQRITEKRYGK